MDDMNKDDMSKKEDFNFEWLPGFREMMYARMTVRHNRYSRQNSCSRKNRNTGKIMNILFKCCRWLFGKYGLLRMPYLTGMNMREALFIPNIRIR